MRQNRHINTLLQKRQLIFIGNHRMQRIFNIEVYLVLNIAGTTGKLTAQTAEL
ncbi:Uncharacterised protein [Vibrio cholerae]|nr:Uncharacterised protein [Vibrio cholerae]